MNKIALFSAAVALVASGALRGADMPKASSAEIIFDHPEKFTDIQDQLMPTEKGQQAILDTLRQHLELQASHYAPEGCKLSMTFTDISLAGKFEPWRGPNFDQVRIVTPIYPPRFIFTWSVTDAAGKVIKQGKEDIWDYSFYYRVVLDPNDPLRYEKQILSDWMVGSMNSVKRLVASS